MRTSSETGTCSQPTSVSKHEPLRRVRRASGHGRDRTDRVMRRRRYGGHVLNDTRGEHLLNGLAAKREQRDRRVDGLRVRHVTLRVQYPVELLLVQVLVDHRRPRA